VLHELRESQEVKPMFNPHQDFPFCGADPSLTWILWVQVRVFVRTDLILDVDSMGPGQEFVGMAQLDMALTSPCQRAGYLLNCEAVLDLNWGFSNHGLGVTPEKGWLLTWSP